MAGVGPYYLAGRQRVRAEPWEWPPESARVIFAAQNWSWQGVGDLGRRTCVISGAARSARRGDPLRALAGQPADSPALS